MNKIKEILNYTFSFGEKIQISVLAVLVLIFTLILTAFVLKLLRRVITKKLPVNDKAKFISVFNYLKWLAYVVIFLVTLNTSGVNVTAVFAASAALLIGVGLALQTLFQDIISGIFILIDQTVHAGDIIELEGKIGRVEEINLRTTRAVTIDNKVMIIPNHLYLTNTLFNWTANGEETRESVEIGVAYGSDVQLVKKLLLEAVNSHSSVLKSTKAMVFFSDFGDSSLNFRVAFSLNNSFEVKVIQSEIRFEIDRLFREHKISIPFPQRDIHIIDKKN
jgi:small-conductance mechanosensitive channel